MIFGSQRGADVLSGDAFRNLPQHFGITIQIFGAFVREAAARLAQFVNQRYGNHGSNSKSCSGVTIMGETKSYG